MVWQIITSGRKPFILLMFLTEHPVPCNVCCVSSFTVTGVRRTDKFFTRFHATLIVGMSSPNVAICSVILVLVHNAFGTSLEPHLVARKRWEEVRGYVCVWGLDNDPLTSVYEACLVCRRICGQFEAPARGVALPYTTANALDESMKPPPIINSLFPGWSSLFQTGYKMAAETSK